MPSIAHLFLGGMIGYALYLISDKRFSKYHVMILFLANYLGPDIGWVLGIGDFTHSYAGYLVFAFLLAFFYSYFTRFSPDFKRRLLVDSGSNRVPYASAYFLACAGGIMHVYLDGVINHQGDFHLFPAIGNIDELVVSINDFVNLWYEPPVPANAIVAVIAGMGLVLAFIPFFWYLLKNLDRRFVLKVAAFVATFMVLFFFFGGFTTYHSDGGAILYTALFWVAPIGLCAAAMKCPPPRSPPADRGKLKQKLLPGLLVTGVIIGVVFVAVGAALLALADVLIPALAGLSVDSVHPLAPHEASLRTLDAFLGSSFIAMGCVNFLLFAWYKKRGTNVNIVVAAGVTIALGFIGTVLAGSLLISGAAIADVVLAAVSGAGGIFTPSDLLTVAFAAGVIMSCIAVMSFVVGAGIVLERKKMLRLAFLVNAAISWTVIGLYVCCLLSQDGVTSRASPETRPCAPGGRS